jgi:hypothetical protein
VGLSGLGGIRKIYPSLFAIDKESYMLDGKPG